jgi:hypothetical protein
MSLEALALEYVNDRHIDNDCGRMEAGMDGEAMRNRKPAERLLGGGVVCGM